MIALTLCLALAGMLAMSMVLPTHADAAAPRLRTFANVEYQQLDGGARLHYDAFRIDDRARRPVVVLLHGGGWWRGSRRDFVDRRPLAQALARAGYVAVTVDYRLACGTPEQPRRAFGFAYTGEVERCGARIDEQRRDVRAAIADVRSRAGTLGVDQRRLAVLGVSAGGHLALLAGIDSPSWVRAIVNVSGPTSTRFVRTQVPRPAPPVRTIRASFTNAVGCHYFQCTERWDEVDPIGLVQQDRSIRFALLTMAGASETQVPARTMLPFGRVLRVRKAHVEQLAVPGRCHGTSCLYARPTRGWSGPRPLARVLMFLQRALA